MERNFPKRARSGHKAFYGGLSGAVAKLRQLGFDVTELAPRLLVLAQNEISADPSHNWQDVEGERYQFPNGYRNKIVPGAKFIYYRGKRRRTGQGEPDYFGWGVIGEVMKDPNSTPNRAARQKWVAEVAEYWPFPKAVPFRDAGGEYLETGTRVVARNYFGVGVREIDPDKFLDILSRGGYGAIAKVSGPPAMLISTQPRAVEDGETLLVPVRRSPDKNGERGIPSGGGRRYSGQAKQVGDRAEELFLDWLREKESDVEKRERIVWVAAHGETPGYDIEDKRVSPTVAYEVKGTAGRCFPLWT